MIDKYLDKNNDTFNLKTVLQRNIIVSGIKVKKYKKLGMPHEFCEFIEKYTVKPDPFVHICSCDGIKEQYYRNLLIKVKRYELLYREIFDKFVKTRISMVLIIIMGEMHYKVIKNYFQEMYIECKYTNNFEDALILFYEKNIL